MRTQRYFRTLYILVAFLFGISEETWADLSATDIVIDNGISNGTVEASVTDRTVTLTVTPASGYKIKKDLIVVEKMVKPDRSSARRRAPGIGTFDLTTGPDGWVMSATEYTFTIPAEYDGAYVTATFVSATATATLITSLNEINDPNGSYKLARDINASGFSGLSTPFTGTLDGDGHTIYGLGTPLFSSISGGTVKNLFFDNISISSGTNVGAICCNAIGYTRIYNCGILSGSVSGSNYVGSIVGLLDGSARVINCYSYANITGGAEVGGIVGYNNGTTTAGEINTMVMNCMFYGDITGGSIVAPVYGGNCIENLHGGLNTFNYYAYDELKTNAISSDKYNCALAISNKFLTRFEIYRLLLNSNNKLAAYYASSSTATVKATDMMKWVLETADRSIDTKDAKPYPILKKRFNDDGTTARYPSIINYDIEHAPDSATVGRNHGGKLGKTLSVTINSGSNAPDGASLIKTSLTLQRTDKDFDHFNFNYDKVQLPYYNDVGTGNYTNYKVVTGWKITSITGGTAGTFTAADEFGGYNFADRNCTAKDIYSETNKRVFSQGAYFDVPYGVTAITIEPYWGTATYVADEYLDVVYNTGYTAQGVTQLSTQFPEGKITINGSEQTVNKSIGDALKNKSASSVYDLAVVLVGNLHTADVPSKGDTPFTIMSVDLDKDNEPDYSYIYSHGARTTTAPIRFDFLNIPGTAQAQKPKGADQLRNAAIFKTRGWFELTNTALMYFSQIEYENLKVENNDGHKKESAPFILQGGVVDQIVSTQSTNVTGKTIYILVGGNVWFKTFSMGVHGDGSNATPHVPVSVTGGDYDSFYLTGTYNPNASVYNDNAECYISGGRFGEVAGAGQEQIGTVNGGKGDIRWQIYNADIREFYGGGINDAKPAQGDIQTDIFNSYVEKFCGGPKFGNMATNKTIKKKVVTNATGCTFGKYFGAGNGGNSYSRKKYFDNTTFNWTTLNGYYTGDKGKFYDGKTTDAVQSKYGKKGYGVATDMDYEFFVWTSGTAGVRFYVNFASFSLAQCNDVTSTLTNCTIEQDFYGGGNLGSVVGTAKSTLNGCTVHGNVFGGGYSAELPKIPVRNGGFTKNPNFNSNSGMFEPGVFSGTTDYDWKHVSEDPNDGAAGTEDNKYVKTKADLTALGQVSHTDLTVTNNCLIEGSVFGGGDMSAVNHNTLVKIENEKTSGDIQNTILNVYGGGNTADVLGNTEVNMTSGNVTQDVYGGGKGASTVVGGNVTVNLGTKGGESAPFSYTGTGTVQGNVYGGSALGAVNAKKEGNSTLYSGTDADPKTTSVNIYSGTINGSVFGGGLGHDDTDDTKDIVAKNFGNTMVTVENSNKDNALVKTAVYGGANENGVVKANTTVTITGGTIGTAPETATNIANTVFGGGFGQPTLVEGGVNVTIGSSAAEPVNTNPVIYGSVYGGSALGGVNVNEAGVDQADKAVAVNLYGGTINGNVFGGGLGQKTGENGATSDIAARVGGGVNVLLDGAKLVTQHLGSKTDSNDDRTFVSGQIFGCNNLNGSPKGHVKVWVKRTVGSDKSSEQALAKTREQRTTYDVAAVYGGGNKADYIPTNATLVTDPSAEGYDLGNPAKVAAACAEVLVEGCDLTSIEYVYGGGNAAAVPATDVTILGDYIINYVFGGGNGKSTTHASGNPGADVGISNRTAYATDPTTGIYGSGKAETKLVGGHIMYVFGGSNTKGNVRGGTSVTMPDKSLYPSPYNCCNVRDIKEIYGAGNQAEQDGAVTMILGCVDNMDYVYGGARAADVKGGVDLVVTSGHFIGVYGGNDQSGTIQGPITLTIEETGCDPLKIDNLYLGGNKAAYSVYGYYTDTNDGNKVKPRSSLNDHTANAFGAPTTNYSETQWYQDPILNIISCTSIGNAFGGGYGSGADMYGSPTVNVNMIPGDFAAQIDRDGNGKADGDATLLGTIGNVYGGGEEANVEGNTTVNICTEEKVAVRSKKGAPYTGTQTAVQGALITNNVFGAGKGLESNVNLALVSGNTTILMEKGSVAKSIYGGGELSQVGGNTNITIRSGEIGDKNNEHGGETIGNIYGGGKGNTSNVRSGLVKGNTNILIENLVADAAWVEAHPNAGKSAGDVLSSPSIYHNIYGGGAHGSVGTYTYDSDAADAAINALATQNTTEENTTGVATITITGGTIGINGHENGMIFGSSRGDIDDPDAIHDKMAWVYDTHVIIGTANDATDGPTIHGSLYGSGENGHTFHDTEVKMFSGTIGDPDNFYAYRGNVYGGGCGTDKYHSTGTETHLGDGDTYNPNAGIVKGNAKVTINGGNIANNIYGAGAMGKVEGNTSVTINTDGAIGVDGNNDDGNVYGAARGELGLGNEYASVTNSSVTLTKGTVRGSLYGGGKAGVVNGKVEVSLNGGTVNRDVYGGGALAKTNTQYHATEHPTYTTTVNLAGTTVTRNLYGGGLGQLAADAVLYADVAEYNAAKGTSLTSGEFDALTTEQKTKTDAVAAIEADVNGPVTVTVSNGKAANVFGCNNLNGSPKQTASVVITGTATVNAGSAITNVYGGGNEAAYTGTGGVSVSMSGGTADYVYGGGLGSTAVVNGSTSVTISKTETTSPVIAHDVFGGGSLADVTGNVNVNVSGGTITNDVYGGGALANTNTANWDATANNWKVTSSSSQDYYEQVKHLTVGTSSVEGFYTDTSGGGYQGSGAKAQANTTYYNKLSYNPNIYNLAKSYNPYTVDNLAEHGTTYKTIVNLTGGVIGNVYGGGLGRLASTGVDAVAAMVYGDVAIKVDGAAFTALVEPSAKNAPVTGRVFGCNNINGTPKGNVTVLINKTKRIDGGAHTLGEFEIQGVYGGGNLANYTPQTYDSNTEFGQSTKVIINDCEASISKVYGGGNAAVVPFTDVTINGAFEIGYAFGGGNGGDMIYKNGSWIDNTGADVTYYTNVLLKGGTIGQAFGGSDSKGSVGGSDIRQVTGGLCPLRLVNLYGAGNGEQASSAGDITVGVSGCGEYSEIQNVYGGSYKANITGNVTLNIKSGIFTSVYGGNDRMGSIGGNITVNIEETDDCDKPIIIQNLYGGCYQTAYPGENARTWDKVNDKNSDSSYSPFTSGKIFVNVKSATRIDRIFGGSERGEVTGDTEVNINMVRGSMSGHSNVTLPSYYAESGASIPSNITVNPEMGWISAYVFIPTPAEAAEGRERSSVDGYSTKDIYTKATGKAVENVDYYQEDNGDYTKVTTVSVGDDVSSYYTHSESNDYISVTGKAKKGYTYFKQVVQGSIAEGIGTIGDVFGGGNIGKVTGNTVVNIGTEQTVTMETVDDNNETTTVDEKHPKVLGAHIYGDVFGGCNNATVTENTEVNIGTANYSTTTGFEGIFIDTDGKGNGGTVYGGGNQGDVEGNTQVTMEGGQRTEDHDVYVFNGIFGGGYAGSVGKYDKSYAEADLNVYGHTAHTGCIGKPKTCTKGGKCTVVVRGGQIGPVDVAVDGMNRSVAEGGPVAEGWIWGGGRGVIEDPAVDPDTHFRSYVNETDVTIEGTAFILESVIGGGEFGRVLHDTKVTIAGNCQIGVGNGQYNKDDNNKPTTPIRYTDGHDYGNGATTNQFINPLETTVTSGVGGNALAECSHFPYGKNVGTDENPDWVYLPFDPYYKDFTQYVSAHPDLSPASTDNPSDGKSWIGCVFGGGSGYMPYKIKEGNNAVGYDWCRSAGWVEGNTNVEIKGGHILTNVYGANEYTDVKGKATVTMTGGTIGVPRTLEDIAKHPVSCYLFGGGKGDERSHFNQYTNVGSVEVNVSGGIIYGSVFGGAEDGHVLGDAIVNISGTAVIGTWGTSYVDGNIFGGGRGFSGKNLNAGTIRGNTEVNISGGTMLGSIYGGGRMASVGTDFSNAQDPNTGQFIEDEGDKTYGHVTINISGGTIGNTYENITLAETDATNWDDSNWKTWKVTNHVPNTEFILDSSTKVYRASHTKGGNVYGGSMGRLTLLNGDPNVLWTRLAQTKNASINITGGSVLRNVYGGAEFGTTRDHTYVTIGGTRNKSTGAIEASGTPTIDGHVFGGGYGSTIDDASYISNIDAGDTRYLFTPMQYAGIIGGETEVNIAGGTVKKNVYGGGELASVGIIDFSVQEDNNGSITFDNKKYSYKNVIKHDDIHDAGKTSENVYGFGLSWPYKFEYVPTVKDGNSYKNGGKATVTVTGGRLGTGYDNGTGYVFGGSKGQVAFKKKVKNDQDALVEVDITDIHEQRYTEAFCANVRETEVKIKYNAPTPVISDPQSIGAEVNCIMGAVYGGGEDGHVYENTAIKFENGLTGLSIYGGGKGISTYTGTKYVYNESTETWTKDNVADMPSWTAGKVYGNTSITMTGGHVSGNVYGGGYLGSVGKGNYASGTDDYYPAGYGETLISNETYGDGKLWTSSDNFNPDENITTSNTPHTMADYFLSSGKCTINITGGKVGTLNGLYGYVQGTNNGTPTGMIFGGSRGRAARDVGALSPRYEYAPDFFLGYCNNTEVTIGTRNAETGPMIYSQVFGGGRDGHVRGSAKVEINAGTIGQTYDESEDDYQRYHRGNVYGSGSGLGTWDEGKHHGTSSGSVTRNTTVDIYGGTIYNNVYGGGAMACVGPPRIPINSVMPDYAGRDVSLCQVNIHGGTIGIAEDYESHKYGGCVYGASRGDRGGNFGDLAEDESIEDYATVLWTEVNINPHPSNRLKDAKIYGNVYGGAKGGLVKKDTEVNLKGGRIYHDVYGGGEGTRESGANMNGIAADVEGNTTVELNKGVADNAKGCIVDKIYGCNDLNGTPKGHVTVHVYATQNANTANISMKVGPGSPASLEKGENEGYVTYLTRLINLAKDGENVKTGITASVISDAEVTIDGKSDNTLTTEQETAISNAAKNVIAELEKTHDYDVTAVYGGGDLAPYEPTDAYSTDADLKEKACTKVTIEGCQVTSIKQVYGGSNAASVPATDVNVISCSIIDEVFGGGNGKDNYTINGKWYENPGAHVGYTQFAYYNTDGTQGTGVDEANKYKALVPSEADGNTEAAKTYRQTHYRYGTGVATTTINGGHMHNIYGGSNQKGNVSGEARSEFLQTGTCKMVYDEAYGGGKNADTDAETTSVLDCVEDGGTIFGGSFNANINSDVNIHITNGSYDKIFGGNNEAGTINGKITITIEEYGCTPIRINELYAGGNLAPYSVYGFKNETELAKDKDGNDRTGVNQRIPYRAGEIGARTKPYWDPRINIISATEIGTIYGGGYGAGATMIGNPHINVNMTKGRIRAKYADFKPEYTSLDPATDGDKYLPIGEIGTIYGGGNLASVEGDTYVEIGTGQWIASWDANGNPVWESTTANGEEYSYKEKTAAVYYTQEECDDHNKTIDGYIASGTALNAEQANKVNTTLGTSYVEGAELMTKDANAYNATLTGAIKTSDVKTAAVYYTQEECDEHNATLPGALNSTDALTAEQAAAYNAAITNGAKAAGDVLDADEAKAYNRTLSGAVTTSSVKTPAVYYTQAECDEANKNLTNYIPKHKKLTAAEAIRVNTALTPSYSANDQISAADANAYNATLPNARKTTDVKTEAVWAWYDADGNEVTTPLNLNPRNAATITGNVFGGGKGEAKTSGEGAFQCAKGMIGVDGDGIDYPEGGTSVIIANGTIGTIENEKLKAGTGNVYGGGEIGRVEKNTVVTIGMTPEEGETISNTKFKPTILGSVFGAGKGVDTHGYSALVRGNSNVTIQGFAKVGESVYGGGEIASIGRYNVVDGIPTSLKNPNSGNCVVTVRDDAEIGPDNMTMFHVDSEGNIVADDQPDNSGHVFGAGKGATPGDYTFSGTSYPYHMTLDNGGNSVWEPIGSESAYLTFIETLALATHTDVTIGGNAFVKGDVFGGSEQGFVQHDTHVTIEGDCQIGNGYAQMADDGTYLNKLTSPVNHIAINRRYSDAEWKAGHLITVDSDPDALKTLAATHYTSSLPECASWLYGQATDTETKINKYAAHDPFDGTSEYDSKGGRTVADNGRTFYGNVFGGGSGYFPYKPGKWHWKAGEVGGNTLVEIKGGHVLTNVYGANEMTNVDGKATVKMTGGTIGVPRTVGQIMKHPVTCYLFGGGAGDPRVLFNKQTNVQDVEVIIEGGWIYGSVFGGGEDGHVMRNVTMNISGNEIDKTKTSAQAYADLYAGNATKIGTWGTSYVDGNVFGGGRGFAGNAYTAGNVAGSATINITGGTMLGSIYGGGRLGSVGYGLYDEKTSGGDPTPGYGEMRDDHLFDDGTADGGFFTKGRGHVEITINGGTIGNTNEFIVPQASNIPDGLDADFKKWDANNWTTWKNHNNVPLTDFDTTNGRVVHTKGGNVYAGGMGRYTQLDGSTPISAVDWWKLGNVKSTTLNISGTPWIMGNVYGGGEFGAIRSYVKGETVEGGTTTIDIQGGTIGTEIKETVTEGEEPNTTTTEVTRYTFGSVYGGGYGTEAEINKIDEHNKVNKLGALVDGNTTVSMSDGHVWASVFGGGEVAAVGGNTNVTISGGKIGKGEVKPKTDPDPGYVMFGGATMGNVYGGGKGNNTHTLIGVVKGNTNVTINAGSKEGEPFIYHNVYGGGALGSVGTFTFSDGVNNLAYVPKGNPLEWEANTGKATINITGGTIGISGRDNGMVNGSSRGDVAKPTATTLFGNSTTHKKDPYDKMAWVNTTEVNIGTQNATTGPHIKGSVYGGGENGHVFHLATVNVKSGKIGVFKGDDWYDFGNKDINEKAWITRGNVYGAGCGTDTYTDDNGKELHNPWAGCVVGNTEVNISGGLIAQSVYGGGSMGSVGSIKNDPTASDQQHPDPETEFALSWPVVLEYQDLTDKTTTGKTTINITGGRIGTTGSDNGDVFGGTRGEAGDRYEMAQFANVKETVVNIDYKDANNNAYTPGDDKIEIYEKKDEDDNQLTFSLKLKDEEPGITGSVYGGCENGHVYKNTQVNIKNGFIGHAVYGGGKGKGKYTPSGGSKKVHSITAGKVYGNTEVNMTGGRVLRNIYGGGNLGSIGKGNYAGGADDFYPAGYGEKITVDLWTTSANEANPDNAWYFLNSGIATVNIIGGIVGYMPNDDTKVTPCDEQGTPSTSSTTYKLASADANMKEILFNVLMKDDMPTGNVFGGCRGQATAEPGSMVLNSETVDFFCGYVNETNVTIGQEAKDAVGEVGDNGYEPAVPESSPRIYGSVYGGGQDGHVRRSTNVSIKKGEIGIPYNETYRTLIGTKDLTPEKELNNLNWLHRGNIYGGGSGIGKYEDSEKKMHNSSSAGSVTHTTTINVGNGITGVAGTQAAPGNVIYRNVYGGGSLASVIPPSLLFSSSTSEGPYADDTQGKGKMAVNTVNIAGAVGVIEGYKEEYGGEVYGAGRGDESVEHPEWFALSVWTKVHIMNGANIMGNVFGGGDAGVVKKDTEVIVGAE